MRLFRGETTFLWPRDKIISALKGLRRFVVEMMPVEGDLRSKAITCLDIQDQESGIRFALWLVPRSPTNPNEIAILSFMALMAGANVSQQTLDGINGRFRLSQLVLDDDGACFLEADLAPKVPFDLRTLFMIVGGWLADVSDALAALRQYNPNVKAFREHARRFGAAIDINSVKLPRPLVHRGRDYDKAFRVGRHAQSLR